MIGDSPAGARRRVRLAIREAREAKGFTQTQVADEMEWSPSKVIRIESGEVTITPNDLRPLLRYLGIRERAVVDQLVEDARTSRRRAMWWDEPQYREHLTGPSRQLVQYEAEAIEFRYFVLAHIPGSLQTKEYAHAILRSFDTLTDDQVEARLASRMRRRTQLAGRMDQVKLHVVLDETALRRKQAPAAVMAAQFAELLRLSDEQNVTIRVLDFDADVPPPNIGPFEILTLPGGANNAVVYRESINLDEVVEDPANVARHQRTFETLWQGALDEAASRAMIEATVKLLDDGTDSTRGRTRPTRPPARSRRAQPK